MKVAVKTKAGAAMQKHLLVRLTRNQQSPSKVAVLKVTKLTKATAVAATSNQQSPTTVATAKVTKPAKVTTTKPKTTTVGKKQNNSDKGNINSKKYD
jgi:hypothetical protein